MNPKNFRSYLVEKKLPKSGSMEANPLGDFETLKKIIKYMENDAIENLLDLPLCILENNKFTVFGERKYFATERERKILSFAGNKIQFIDESLLDLLPKDNESLAKIYIYKVDLNSIADILFSTINSKKTKKEIIPLSSVTFPTPEWLTEFWKYFSNQYSSTYPRKLDELPILPVDLCNNASSPPQIYLTKFIHSSKIMIPKNAKWSQHLLDIGFTICSSFVPQGKIKEKFLICTPLNILHQLRSISRERLEQASPKSRHFLLKQLNKLSEREILENENLVRNIPFFEKKQVFSLQNMCATYIWNNMTKMKEKYPQVSFFNTIYFI